MKYTVTRVSVHQSSKTLAVLYSLFGVLYVPLMLLANTTLPVQERMPAILLWSMPILLGLLGYIMFALLLALYNWVASFTGGIELKLGSEDIS